MTDLRSATNIAEAVNSGAVSPIDVLNEHLARIEALDGSIEAWPYVDSDAARSAAERLAAAAPGARGALAGIPVGIKDIIDVAGMPTGLGADFARYTPANDATAVARLRAAGALILGKTATTQFAHVDPAPTRNPWNLEHTPGGSSSGSGAAVAAGMVAAALGTQTVGSMLRPAAYCGVVGLKPTHGRIGTSGVFPVAPNLDHVGIFARSVADAALLLNIIAGYDPNDPNSQEHEVDDYLAAATGPQRPPRLAYARRFPAGVAEDEVLRHLDSVAEALAGAGATVTEIDLPLRPQEIAAISRVIHQTEAAMSHETLFRTESSQYRTHLRSLIEAGMATHAVEYLRAMNRRRQMRQSLEVLIGENDALLLPTATSTALRGLDSTGNSIFCAPASLSGLPSISLPSGLGANGLPLAVQLVSRPWQETALLRTASWLEDALAFSQRPAVLESWAR